MVHYEGKGVVQNYGEAIRHYKLAAAQGHVCGQFKIGLMYEEWHWAFPKRSGTAYECHQAVIMSVLVQLRVSGRE